jgi:hypothetical protein
MRGDMHVGNSLCPAGRLKSLEEGIGLRQLQEEYLLHLYACLSTNLFIPGPVGMIYQST